VRSKNPTEVADLADYDLGNNIGMA